MIISKHQVETFSGAFVDTKNPDANSIVLEDIAHALANTCRYGGHCRGFYSVAEHAVFCSIRMQRQGFSRKMCLAALHHDDAEAFLGDIPRPLKPLLGNVYKMLTARMDKAIIAGLGLPFDVQEFHSPELKEADNWSLFVEARHLLPSGGRHWLVGDQGAEEWDLSAQPSRIVVPDYWLGGVSPTEAEGLYLSRHWELI